MQKATASCICKNLSLKNNPLYGILSFTFKPLQETQKPFDWSTNHVLLVAASIYWDEELWITWISMGWPVDVADVNLPMSKGQTNTSHMDIMATNILINLQLSGLILYTYHWKLHLLYNWFIISAGCHLGSDTSCNRVQDSDLICREIII